MAKKKKCFCLFISLPLALLKNILFYARNTEYNKQTNKQKKQMACKNPFHRTKKMWNRFQKQIELKRKYQIYFFQKKKHSKTLGFKCFFSLPLPFTPFSLRLKFQQQKTFWIDRFRFFSFTQRKKSLQQTMDDESVEREI